MAEAYERERQNNARLEELAAKVGDLRGVTVDIYNYARDQDIIDDTSNTFVNLSGSLRGSAHRLTRMAAAGNKVAVLKLSAIIVFVVLTLYYAAKLFL